MCVYAMFRLVAILWMADQQEIEGVMSMIQAAAAAAPRITQAVLDARVGVRKRLELGSRGSLHIKWSQVEQRVETTLRQAVQHFAGGLTIMEDTQRFKPPNRSLVPIPDRLILPLPEYGRARPMACTKASNSAWKALYNNGALDAIQFDDVAGDPDDIGTLWYCAQWCGTVGRMLRFLIGPMLGLHKV